jgi:ubiquinone/menaquinone biosynthesis C-methylase UbiE
MEELTMSIFRLKNPIVLAALLALATGKLLSAQIGSQPAAEWIPHLEDPKRVATLHIDEVIKTIGLKPGMVIADIGSGSGVFTRPFAKAVAGASGGPSGKAIAVDIDSALLSYVSESAGKQGIKNIETHLAPIDDPKLSGAILDVAFFHDVFHHIEHRDVYVKNLAKYMKPDGRIVLIENAAGHEGMHDAMHPDGNAAMHQAMHGDTHQTMMHNGKQVEMSTERQTADKLLDAAGFKPIQESDLFGAGKFFVIYGRK